MDTIIKGKDLEQLDSSGKMEIVVLDAWHGDQDYGITKKVGDKIYTARDILLETAYCVAWILSTSHQVGAVLTRTTQHAVDTDTKLRVVNQPDKSLCISLCSYQEGLPKILTYITPCDIVFGHYVKKSLQQLDLPVNEVKTVNQLSHLILSKSYVPACLIDLGGYNEKGLLTFLIDHENQIKFGKAVLTGVLNYLELFKPENQPKILRERPRYHLAEGAIVT